MNYTQGNLFPKFDHAKRRWVVVNVSKTLPAFGMFGTEREALDAIAAYFAKGARS